MLNLAARFREAIDQLATCPDAELAQKATQLKGLIESYDNQGMTEAQLKTAIEELRDSITETCMVKTTCINILTVPVDVDGLHLPPQPDTVNIL